MARGESREHGRSGADQMAMQNSQSEPSMEEILASIRRIISEDDDTSKRAAEPPLELTKPAPPAADPNDDLMVFEEEEEFEPPPPPRVEPPRPAPQPVARAPIPPMPAPVDHSEDALASGEAINAAAGAFTRLAGTLRLSEAPGQTLEGIVRELLRPMMKEWLDQNLAAIVEAKVEAELDRISRLSR